MGWINRFWKRKPPRRSVPETAAAPAVPAIDDRAMAPNAVDASESAVAGAGASAVSVDPVPSGSAPAGAAATPAPPSAASSPADVAYAVDATPGEASGTVGDEGVGDVAGVAGVMPGAGGATSAGVDAVPPPETSALNQKIVQAVDFSNAQTMQYLLPAMIRTPPDVMATQSAGLAVQDAANYMNAIMQIALAAQAVIAKKAAEGPVQAAEQLPVLAEMQKMVASAVEVYGTVSQAAGTSASTIGHDVSSITSG